MHHTSCYCARCQCGSPTASFEVLSFPSMSSTAALSEAEETELAMELLSVASEEELEQF